ncbi:MAG: amidohydrolase family protein [Acidobacteriaceae bacterium]|nr:amidohydrolase family protein [Acidobacteriaceae bacterium]
MRRFLLLLVSVTVLVVPAGYSQESTALLNATVIDGTDHPPRRNVTVVIEGTKIVSIIDSTQPLPQGTKRLNARGKFLIPGLWNNDLHGSFEDGKAHFPDLLSAGVTTIRDMGAPLDDIVRLRAATASGTLVGPRVFIAGPLMEGPTPIHMGLIVDLFSEAQAREEVRTLKQHGVDYVEVDTTLTPELYWAIADEAKHQGLPLVGHIPAKISPWDLPRARQIDVEHLGGRFFNVLVACSSQEDGFMKQLASIYDNALKSLAEKKPIAEPQFKADFVQQLLGTFDEHKAQRLFRLYAANGIAQTPTLSALKTLWETNSERSQLNDRDMEAGKRIFAKDLEIVREMKSDGVTILAGTDGSYGQGGEALHAELKLLVDAGLTPLQALQAASRNAARAVGVAGEVGTIEVGKTADLVVLSANPLEDISNVSKIDAVVLRGRYLSKEELSALKSR